MDKEFWAGKSQMRTDLVSDLTQRSLTIKMLHPSMPWNSGAACLRCATCLGSKRDELVSVSWTRSEAAPSYLLHSRCIPHTKETPYVTNPEAESRWWSGQGVTPRDHLGSHLPHLREGRNFDVRQIGWSSSQMPSQYVQNQQMRFNGPSLVTNAPRQGSAPSGSWQDQGPQYGYHPGYQSGPQQESNPRGHISESSTSSGHLLHPRIEPDVSRESAPSTIEAEPVVDSVSPPSPVKLTSSGHLIM